MDGWMTLAEPQGCSWDDGDDAGGSGGGGSGGGGVSGRCSSSVTVLCPDLPSGTELLVNDVELLGLCWYFCLWWSFSGKLLLIEDLL